MKDITVRTRTLLPMEENEEVSSMPGTIRKKGKAVEIKYLENGKSGLGNTETTITAQENKLTIKRSGDFNSVITYIPGQKTRTDYVTPYGTLDIGMITHSLSWDYSEDGKELFTLDLIYEMELRGEKNGRTFLKLTGEKRDE